MEEKRKKRSKRNINNINTKKKRMSCTTRTHDHSSTTIQTLFFACNSFFKCPNSVPLPLDVNMIHFLLGKSRNKSPFIYVLIIVTKISIN